MQTPHSKSANFFLVEKVAQLSETNEKSILRFFGFLVFEIWSTLYSNFLVNFADSVDDFVFDCLETSFRNANQRYPITRWPGGLYPKASGAQGRSHLK